MRPIDSNAGLFYSVNLLKTYFGISRATLYRAISFCGIRSTHIMKFYSTSPVSFDYSYLWRFIRAPFFKKYFKALSRKGQGANFVDDLEGTSISFDLAQVVARKVVKDLSFLDLTVEQIAKGIYTGLIPLEFEDKESQKNPYVPWWFIENNYRPPNHPWYLIYGLPSRCYQYTSIG